MPLASDTGIDLPGDAAIPNAEPPPSSYTYRWLAHLADRPLPRREVFERSNTQMTFEPGEAVFDSDQDLPYLFMVLRGGIKVADPRFDREIDARTGFHTRCSVTLPLVDHRAQLIGVMQEAGLTRIGFVAAAKR